MYVLRLVCVWQDKTSLSVWYSVCASAAVRPLCVWSDVYVCGKTLYVVGLDVYNVWGKTYVRGKTSVCVVRCIYMCVVRLCMW